MHYVFPIPDFLTDGFYDQEFGLYPGKVLDAYKEGHTELETQRKEKKLKPKEVHEEVHLSDNGILKFLFYLGDDLLTTTKIKIEYPVNPESKDIQNIIKTYEKLHNWVKPGGLCLKYDGLKNNLYNRILNTPEIYFYKVKRPELRIRVPFCRSMFAGINKPSRFDFTIQESTLPGIFIFTITLGKSKLEEIFWGYIINY